MADEQLRLEVSADVSKATSDLNAFITTMGKMRGEGVALDDVIDQFDTSLTRVSKSLRDSSSSAKSNSTSVNSLAREYRELVSEVKSLEYAQKQAAGNARNLQGGSASLQGLDPKQIEAMEAAQRRTTTAYQANNRAMKEAAVVTDEVSTATKDATGSIISQRYALYDVASTYGVISAALLGVSTLAVKTAADFESSFTSVERTFDSSTTIDQMAGIREELVNLSTQIPKTFDELAEVATLGNQLGIASEDITAFTETVAQFSAITGISPEETALAFGQLGNLLGVTADEYDRLGSAIALVGVNSAATESQIVSIAREIAPAARAAGFTADQVIGLSGALGSIRVPPERSRSTMLQFFETLNTAVATGGKSLEDFATVVGVTTSELDSMVRSGKGEEILRRFIGTMDSADTIEITQALQALNLAGLRTNPTIRAMADNTALMNQTFSDGATGFAENTELQRQFALIVDDVNSQVIMLINSLNALIAQLSGGMVPGIAGAIGVLTDMVNWLREVSDNEATQWVAGFALTLVTLVGVLTAFRAASALATASSYALVTAQASLAASGGGAARGILGLIGIITGYTKVAADGTVATLGLRGALIALGRATVVLGIISLATQFIFDFNNSMATTLDIIGPLTGAVNSLAYTFGTFLSSVGSALGWFGGAISDAGKQLQGLAAVGIRTSKEMANWSRDLRLAASETDDFSAATAQVGTYTPDIQALSGAFDNVGDSAKQAAKEVVTLEDYASDLGSVMSRAFEIRFGSQTAMDQVTSRWIDLNEEMAEYRRKVKELTADRKVTKYFLSIAEAYGDTLRAGVLRSDLADIDAELADAQAGVSTELRGNSKAAIENRATITGLVKGYQDYITELAASGASQAELNRAVERSQREFEAQASALGYSTKQLQPYIKSFRDMKVVIDNVPRNITVKVTGLSAAEIALKEFAAKAKKAVGGGFNVPVKMVADNSSVIRALEAQIRGEEARMLSLGAHQTSLVMPMQASIYSLRQQLRALRGFKEGGYTGGGGASAPAGVVHGKEFVFNAQATKNAGVGNLYGMMRAFEQGRGYQSGGYVAARATAPSTGPNVFILDQAQYQGLINSGKVVVQLGSEQIANAVNNTNQQYANLGRS